MIAHILLVPYEGRRGELLAPGAPMSEWLPINATRAWGWVVDGGVAYDSGWRGVPEQPPDLVLARDGDEVYAGTDRLRRVMAAHVGVPVDTGGVVFHGAHGDGLRDRRWTTWTLHDWSSVDSVQFYGDPAQAWSSDGPHKTIHVPALAAPPWPADPRHPLLTVWALALCAQALGLGTILLLDADGREASP